MHQPASSSAATARNGTACSLLPVRLQQPWRLRARGPPALPALPPKHQQHQQQPAQHAGATTPSAAADVPPARAILARRSVVDDDALHRPLGLIAVGSWVLGSAASFVDLPGPAWVPAATGAAIGAVFAAVNRYCCARLWRPPAGPLRVVVTGGTRGLGKALAREFLTHGDAVAITGRSTAALDAAMAELRQELAACGGQQQQQGLLSLQQQQEGSDSSSVGGVRLYGIVCDVTQADDVAALTAEAQDLLGGCIDAWVCNAGASGGFTPFLDSQPGALEAVVRTNLLGALLCARAAARAMLQQELGGHVFLMDGAGADGAATPQYAAYGATKAALPQFAASLAAELAGTHVGVHMLSPGMMLTELLLEGATAANKAAFNILCEQPETVAAFLVPRVRSAISCGLNRTYTRYLTPASAIYRLLTAPARIGRFFDGSGRPVYPPEHERILGRGSKATARRQALARARASSLGLAYSLSLAASVAVMVALEGGGHASSAFTGH